MDNISHQQKHWNAWLAFWLVLHLFLSGMLELSNDEAYYWAWSTRLDWGYFDHPPMVAWLMWLGSLFGDQELLLRLPNVLLTCATLWIFWQLTERKSAWRFWMLMGSSIIFQMYGFVVSPDGLLLFGFGASLYFLTRLSANWWAVLGLGFSMAFMCYSKYPGVLIIVAFVLAIPRLLLSRRFGISCLLALLLYVPHLWWLVSHDFVTVWFQLQGRPLQNGFVGWISALEYLGAQFLMIGAVSVWLIPMWRNLVKTTTSEPLDKVLLSVMALFWVVFFVASWFGKSEGNWTAPAVMALFVWLLRRPKFSMNSWLFRIATFSTMLFFIAKILLPFGLTLGLGRLSDEFSGWKSWANDIQQKAKGAPVVFAASYQKASKYMYHLPEHPLTYSYPNIHYRQSQFDLWRTDTMIEQSGQVFLVNNWEEPGFAVEALPVHGPLIFKSLPYFSSTVSWSAIQCVGKSASGIEIQFATNKNMVRFVKMRKLNMAVSYFSKNHYLGTLHYPVEAHGAEVRMKLPLDSISFPTFDRLKLGYQITDLPGTVQLEIAF